MAADPKDCFACRCDAMSMRPSTAFIAGIAFALQHNAAAMATVICLEHAEAMARGHAGTTPLMKRRKPEVVVTFRMFAIRAFAPMLSLLGCGGYADTFTPAGIPNFHPFPDADHPVDGMYRTGVPPTPAAWAELRQLVEQSGKRVTKVVLHDREEGDESPAVGFGWTVVWIPLPPAEDKPLDFLSKPPVADVQRAVDTILAAHARGDVVVWGCKHDRDRGGLISALVGRRLLGWTKQQAWDYAIATGLRWELPDLDIYWLEDVPNAR